MTVNEHALTLDVSKGDSWQLPQITIRQGDCKGTTIKAKVTDNGEPFAFAEGDAAFFDMMLPDRGTFYREEGRISGSEVTVTLDETRAGAVPGDTKIAYISIERGGSLIASTGNVKVHVERNAKAGALPAQTWISGIDDALAAMESATQSATAASSAADAAAEAASAAAAEVSGETARQASAFAESEAARASSYEEAEAARNSSYMAAESTRNESYRIAEAGRESLFSAAQSERADAYTDAESSRNSASSAAVEAANTAAGGANAKAALANDAATAATSAAASANAKAALANDAATAATSAAESANAKAALANDAATAATSAAASANAATEAAQRATETMTDLVEEVGDISALAVPLMTAEVRGGAMLGDGLNVSGGRLNSNIVFGYEKVGDADVPTVTIVY